ncbi:MAG: tetratricopeptide repeat protein [Candidatus Aminicenantes bacterium]|nr:tetratricopeptide repeat protein [Candidatus Aminicenantes bacterium]
MPKRAVLPVLFLSGLFFFGQAAHPKGGQVLTPAAKAAELVSFLRDDSFRAAAKLADRLLADQALDVETMAVCGLAVLLGGRIDEAETILTKAIERSPDNPEAHLGLGRIARIRNDRDGAVAHLRRAVPSAEFYGDALRHLWRASWDDGLVDDILGIYRLAEERYSRESRPLPSWFTNGLAQVKGLAGKRLFEMEGRFERLTVPLKTYANPQVRVRMIDLKINGRGEYPFHIDSASADFLTLSPLLAEDLGLVPTGSSTAVGVGTAEVAVRFSMLDKVELGPLTFRNVPVMVSDIRTLRGLKEGLIGTAMLKRFNVTIDVKAGSWTSSLWTVPSFSPPASTGRPWPRTCRFICSTRRPSRPPSPERPRRSTSWTRPPPRTSSTARSSRNTSSRSSTRAGSSLGTSGGREGPNRSTWSTA